MIARSRTLLLKLIVSYLLVHASVPGQSTAPAADGWSALPSITARIVSPTFPDREFRVTAFGAVGDGVTNCTSAFATAISKCNASGGGRVVVPAGAYLTGAIHLKSNVNLEVQKGATIIFSTDPAAYLPVVYTRWEGIECLNYSALIYAYGQSNIAVTGEGVLDGRGSPERWWNWKGNAESGWKKGSPSQKDARAKLMAMAEQGVPVEQRVFGDASFLRPNFFQSYKCENVLVRGVTFRNSPMWFLHPVLCRNVSFMEVTVEGLGPNNDGCDPESCTDVLIEKCFFNTGDDCIAIKSGRNADGRRVNVPTRNVVIRGCAMREGHGGVVIGSEISGGVANVFAEECTMDSPNLERALRIKTNAVRGGIIENIFMRNIRVGQVSEAVVKVDYYYEEGDTGPSTPVVRNIGIERLDCKQSRFAVWIRAYDRSPAANVSLIHCTFDEVAEPDVLDNVKDLTFIDVKRGGPGKGKAR
jgi:polygalacturonase